MVKESSMFEVREYQKQIGQGEYIVLFDGEWNECENYVDELPEIQFRHVSIEEKR